MFGKTPRTFDWENILLSGAQSNIFDAQSNVVFDKEVYPLIFRRCRLNVCHNQSPLAAD
jgi:hypothetical protein